MSTVADPPKDPANLREVIAYLLRERRPKVQVKMRPYCPTHDVLMLAGKTPSGLTHYYCPCDGCRETWKGRHRVV